MQAALIGSVTDPSAAATAGAVSEEDQGSAAVAPYPAAAAVRPAYAVEAEEDDRAAVVVADPAEAVVAVVAAVEGGNHESHLTD